MGVFPLADTMIRCSDARWSRGHAPAGANGWTNEVWWYADPTTPRRAAAAYSPTDPLKPSDPIMRCSAPGSCWSGFAVPGFAAGNELQ